jgi:hypothetical protein
MKIIAKAIKKGTRLDTFFDDLGNKSPSTITRYKLAIWQYIRFIYNLTDKEKEQCARYV